MATGNTRIDKINMVKSATSPYRFHVVEDGGHWAFTLYKNDKPVATGRRCYERGRAAVTAICDLIDTGRFRAAYGGRDAEKLMSWVDESDIPPFIHDCGNAYIEIEPRNLTYK